MLYSLWKVNHFGGTHCLYVQGRRISQARNRHEAGSKQRHCSNPEDGGILDPENEGIMFLQKVG
jgi:hypothetical protein